MAIDRLRVLAELPLPLRPGAGLLDALAIAVALEESLPITLPDAVIDAAHLGDRSSAEATLVAMTAQD